MSQVKIQQEYFVSYKAGFESGRVQTGDIAISAMEKNTCRGHDAF